MTQDEQTMMAARHVDDQVSLLLALESSVLERRPDRMVRLTPLLIEAYEIAANAHRRGGCTSGQVQRVEEIVAAAREIAA